MVSSRSLLITGLVAAAIGFGFGRLTVPDAGAPAPDFADTVPGKLRTRSDIGHDSRSTSGPPSEKNVSRSEQVRELLIISENRNLDDDLVSQELAGRILGANREELPLLFREIVREGRYSFDAMEFLVRRWAQFDAREIIGILQRHQSKTHWPGEEGLYFKALVAYELVRTASEEGLRLFEQSCRESGGRSVGSGAPPKAPDDLVSDFYRRLVVIDPARGFRAALDSAHPDLALGGAAVAAVETGRGGEMAQLLESVPEEQAEWPRSVLVEAWVRSAPDAAAEWFRSLSSSLQAEFEDDFEAARKYATSSLVDP